MPKFVTATYSMDHSIDALLRLSHVNALYAKDPEAPFTFSLPDTKNEDAYWVVLQFEKREFVNTDGTCVDRGRAKK